MVTNCVAFGNLHKGFDQNNAYEGMYLFNCVAWGNEFNYRFPTELKYGMMDIHNCIGWGATAQKSGHNVGNHEFLSPDKDGYQDPTAGTTYNSWTTIDGCSPIKESYKPDGGDYTPATQDHSGEFLSLSVSDFMAEREDDGSLPNNNFARLKPNSIFKDMGMAVIGFTPERKMTEAQCAAAGLEYITADDLYIPYNDAAPDFGAYETDGVPVDYTIPEKITLTCTTANSSQEVVDGNAIADIVYEWNEAGTTATVEDLAEGLTYSVDGNTLTISGTPQGGCTFKVTVSGNAEEGVKPVTTTGIITLVRPFKVLTGDWYHFQDAWDALPDDLQGVLELIQGDQGTTTIDPVMEESSSGFGKGALSMGKSDGGMRLNLDNGVLELKINLYFTGGRKFKITYKLADGTTKSVTTDSYKKGSYGEYDILVNAGLTNEDDRVNVRNITFQQSGANGGARIYDMLIKVPAANDVPTGITSVGSLTAGKVVKVISNGSLVIRKGDVNYNIQGQEVKGDRGER